MQDHRSRGGRLRRLGDWLRGVPLWSSLCVLLALNAASAYRAAGVAWFVTASAYLVAAAVAAGVLRETWRQHRRARSVTDTLRSLRDRGRISAEDLEAVSRVSHEFERERER